MGPNPWPTTRGRPLTILGYGHRPRLPWRQPTGFRDRKDPTQPSYRQESAVYLWSASHTARTCPFYSTGPGAETLTGVIEQNVIYHALLQAVPALQTKATRTVQRPGPSPSSNPSSPPGRTKPEKAGSRLKAQGSRLKLKAQGSAQGSRLKARLKAQGQGSRPGSRKG